MEEKKKRLKRLTVDIGDELHYAIRSRAALRNITVRTWVLRALLAAISREEHFEKTKLGRVVVPKRDTYDINHMLEDVDKKQ